MAALSIRELVNKLNSFAMKDPDVDKDAMIKNAWVASRNDPNYPEGTVIFEVISNNATLENLYASTHELTIYPDRLGTIN